MGPIGRLGDCVRRVNDGESCELLDLSPAATSNLGIRTQQVAPAAPDSPSLGGDQRKGETTGPWVL